MVTITAPSSSVVTRAASITVSWTTSYPQSAYEVDYKLASSSTWNVLVAKTTSTAKSTTISLGSIQDFSEYHIKVVSYADNTSDGGSPITNYYTGTDQSAGFCLYVVPSGSVSKFKAKVGTGLIEIPLYDSVTTTPKLKARVNSTTTKTAGLVDVGSVGASKLRVNTGTSGIKAAALASPTYYHAGPGKSTYELVKSTYNYYGTYYGKYTYNSSYTYTTVYNYTVPGSYSKLNSYTTYYTYNVPHSYITIYTYTYIYSSAKYDIIGGTYSGYVLLLCQVSSYGYGYYSRKHDNHNSDHIRWLVYQTNYTFAYDHKLNHMNFINCRPFGMAATNMTPVFNTTALSTWDSCSQWLYWAIYINSAESYGTYTTYGSYTYYNTYSWTTYYSYSHVYSWTTYYNYNIPAVYYGKYTYTTQYTYSTLYNYLYTGTYYANLYS